MKWEVKSLSIPVKAVLYGVTLIVKLLCHVRLCSIVLGSYALVYMARWRIGDKAGGDDATRGGRLSRHIELRI